MSTFPIPAVNSIRRSTTLVVTLLAALGSAVSHGEVDSNNTDSDSKYFSAAICGATRGQHLNIGKNGGAFNLSTTQTLDVTCPLLRDMTNTNSMGVDLWVTKATDATMTCYFNSRNFSNTAGLSSTKTVSGTGSKIVSFSILAAQGTYNAGCTLLPATSATGGRTGIVGIQTYELN